MAPEPQIPESLTLHPRACGCPGCERPARHPHPHVEVHIRRRFWLALGRPGCVEELLEARACAVLTSMVGT